MRKALPVISKQMLVNQLKELEEDKIIERVVYAETPPRVEYNLTIYGQSLLPALYTMQDWGLTDLKNETK